MKELIGGVDECNGEEYFVHSNFIKKYEGKLDGLLFDYDKNNKKMNILPNQ